MNTLNKNIIIIMLRRNILIAYKDIILKRERKKEVKVSQKLCLRVYLTLSVSLFHTFKETRYLRISAADVVLVGVGGLSSVDGYVVPYSAAAHSTPEFIT